MRLEWGTRKHDPALARVLISSLFVMDFDISADGMTVVAVVDRGDDVGRLRLWRRDGRDWESGFRRHNRPFVGCALSPDGRQVATFAEDGYVELWDAETASRLCSVMLSSNCDGSAPASLAGLRMSDDGRQVLAIEVDEVWLVDLATRSVAWTARAHRKSLAVYGKFVANQALVFIDGRIMLVDSAGRPKTLFTDTQINDLAPFAEGGGFLARRGNDIQQYDIHGRPGKKIPLDACGNVITFCTDHSGSKAIAGCSNDMMVVFDPSTGAPLAHMKHAGGMVLDLKISGNGRWAVSEPLDAGLYYWNLDAATLGPPPAKTEQFGVIASAFRDNGTIVALALDGRYRLYDMHTGALIEEVCFYESNRLPVDGSVSADGQWVGVIDKTGKITVAEIGGVIRRWQTGADHLHPDTLIRLRIEAGRALVALGKRRLEIWDANTETLVARRALREMPKDFSFAPCGSVVAILTTDARLKLWWPNRSRMQTIPAPEGTNPTRLCLTAGGRTTVVGDVRGSMGVVREDSAILLNSRAISREMIPIQADDTHNLLVSMLGSDRLLLSALPDGERNAGALAGLVFGNIREARLSPAGTHVLVTGDDGAVFMLAIEGGSTPV